MKFAVAALLLGCSVLAYKYAVQSDPIDFGSALPHLARPQQTVELFKRFDFTWLYGPSPLRQETAIRDYKVPPTKVQLSKSEAFALIEAAAIKHCVAAAFVKSIVAAESNFDCNAVSPKGAVGLMQLMPDTARQFGADPTVPEQNIDAGTHYLRTLLNRYEKYRHSLPRVIAAYNAGPGKVDRYRGVPPYRETRQYVARVLGFLRQFELPARRTAKG
jgi:soluble lytic murein transglycosylase-like protein